MLFDLLERGYFPRELPPPFASAEFARYVTSSGQPPGHPWTTSAWTQPLAKQPTVWARHSAARAGSLRRPLGTPNPWSQLLLANEVAVHWNQLHGALHARSRPGPIISASRPVFWRRQGRALIPRYRQNQLPLLRLKTRAGRRYVVHTDIANFYASIYSHSIAWAVEGKAKAKANRTQALLGNRLDALTRNMQDQQSVGIAIGPDTSLLLAECVLRGADDDLVKVLPNLVGFRHIDDYEVACASLAEAEHTLAAIEGCLATYNLVLNPRKTRIAELPHPTDAEWMHSLRDRPTARSEATELNAHFSIAFDLRMRFPEDGVLKYAITQVRSRLPRTSKGWQVLQAALLNCVQGEPACLPVVFDVLARCAIAGLQVNKSALSKTLSAAIVTVQPRAFSESRRMDGRIRT